jgi:hypothetical protein
VVRTEPRSVCLRIPEGDGDDSVSRLGHSPCYREESGCTQLVRLAVDRQSEPMQGEAI